MALRVYGTLRPRNSICSIVVIEVNCFYAYGYIRDIHVSPSDCCLDLDWLDDNTFASCGADMVIFIMKIHEEKPIKTLAYVYHLAQERVTN